MKNKSLLFTKNGNNLVQLVRCKYLGQLGSELKLQNIIIGNIEKRTGKQ